MKLMKRKAQGILEYVIILTAIVGVFLVLGISVIGKKDTSGGLGSLMNQSKTTIETASGKVANILK